jgi:hypothetical protein
VIKIDFMGGLHGNFLCYSINALEPSCRIDSPFTDFGTSHRPYNKQLADVYHYSQLDIPINSTDIISIAANDEDCLLVNLLTYSRAGDCGFDLKNFNVNFYDQLKKTPFMGNMVEHIHTAYNIKINEIDSIPRGTLREYFKFNFHNYEKNNILNEIRKQKYEIDVLELNFKELYTFESYVRLLNLVITRFNLPYHVDTVWYYQLWVEFISKIDAIPWALDALNTLTAIQQGKAKSIDFNLLQESWLNARLEVLYNKEMPFNQEEYFKNTLEIIDYLK